MVIGSNSTERDRRREAAATWWVRLAADDATESDWLAFEQWLDAPENRAQYERIEIAMLAVDENRDALSAGLAERGGQITPFPVHRLRNFAIWASAAAAAVVIAVVGVESLAPEPVQHFAYAAPAYATRQVTLSDGTIVILNRGAAIDAQYSKRERRVALLSGEASFAVKHDAAQAFVVSAGANQITDIGTEFNVLDHDGALTVTVREGVVAISTAATAATRVEHGQQFRADASGAMAVVNVNPDDSFSWRDGRLSYHDATLAAIANDMNRYGGVPVRIADARAASLRFSGVLIIDTPQVMTQHLEDFLPVQSTQDATGIVLRSRNTP